MRGQSKVKRQSKRAYPGLIPYSPQYIVDRPSRWPTFELPISGASASCARPKPPASRPRSNARCGSSPTHCPRRSGSAAGSRRRLRPAPTSTARPVPTRSDTIIGDFVLSDDAQAQSGIGLSLKARAITALPVSAKTDILVRASVRPISTASPISTISPSRSRPGRNGAGGRTASRSRRARRWRWYGLDPYSVTYGLTGNWQHPLPRPEVITTQLELSLPFTAPNMFRKISAFYRNHVSARCLTGSTYNRRDGSEGAILANIASGNISLFVILRSRNSCARSKHVRSPPIQTFSAYP